MVSPQFFRVMLFDVQLHVCDPLRLRLLRLGARVVAAAEPGVAIREGDLGGFHKAVEFSWEVRLRG